MGKVRRLRQKYHASLTKKKVENAAKDQNITNNVLHQVPQIQSGATCDPVNRDNIFAGLQIKLQKLEDVPAPSHVESDNDFRSSRQTVEQPTQFESPMCYGWSCGNTGHELRVAGEIDVVRAGQIAEKNRKKREKTVITGDMHPLLNALPSLGELMASKSKNKRCDLKTLHGTPKQKTAKKETLADIQMFTSIHEDPHFIKDPFRAVALALENRVLYEED
ncbi:hypothetical protein O3P69_011883 [Scylla paramamosain]|uniref:Uncharacterized protein n=1 Tax=Scylla paramamosain TaxID=85552 RepID=A0AAW0SAJ6_SCYPA